MIFECFPKIYSVKGEVCTREKFMQLINDEEVVKGCKKIAAAADHDKQNELKKKYLPAITWVASYGGKTRAAENAIPSGLYMVDVDGIEDPAKVWQEIEAKGVKNLGIVCAHKTPSTKGLRIVAVNQEGFETVVQNQEWFYRQFPNIAFDKVVKDMARGSYIVPFSYIYYIDNDVFEKMWPVYIKEGGQSSDDSSEESSQADSTPGTQDLGTYEWHNLKWFVVQKKSDLFGDKGELLTEEDLKYQELDLRQIVLKWFDLHGGQPQRGSRNTTLFSLFCSLRYICDFSQDVMLACTPASILPRAEVCELIKNASKRERIVGVPKDIREAIAALRDLKKEIEDDEHETVFSLLQSPTDLLAVETLPPVFKQFAQIAPPDFRKASVVALLPLLGTLGSRLRAVYVDGVVQTPSFQCEIEAPMASGKSFARRIYNNVMQKVMEKDAVYREKEAAYEEKVRLAKNQKEQPEKESYPIRLLGSKVSIAALLDRMANAHGLHLLSFDEEVRNVLDSMRSGAYGDIRALLRCAFDNAMYGQDYKSDSSSKRMVAIFYNTLHCGTPAEYRKLYNNAEDGTITRILFADIPDQKFKKMPVFKELTYFQQKEIDKAIKRLSEVSMIGETVQPAFELTGFDFMREWADKWQEDMRQLAIRFNDINLDTYRRRAAVVGFRAGMLAWFLFGKDNDINRKRTCSFAQMIAEQMVVTLMQRFQVQEVSNVIAYKYVWSRLEKEFTLQDVESAALATNCKAPAKQIAYKWRQKNLIEKIDPKTYKKLQR